jgi:tRNA pseudouridine55 synthase
MILNLYKNRGETPLECIQRFAVAHKITDKMTYLGRLDPMAEGVLLLATGEDIKRKEEFLGLDKEYDFRALFGFSTDTYDVLGKITKMEKLESFDENDLRKIANVYEGEREQKYPLYSSKMISSRESFAPESSQVSPESVPSKKINIYKIQFHKLEEFSAKELFGRLLSDISKVKGDFRQTEILEKWKEVLLDDKSALEKYFVAKFSAHVSSGTYIRSLVSDMGNTLGCGATTLSIKRTRVGSYKIEDSEQG